MKVEENNMRIFKLVECSDADMFYGLLVINNDEITMEKVQEKIYDIKNSDEDIFYQGEWTIDDVLERLPEEWKIEYIQETESGNLYI